jgi:hypothetical protein
MHSSQGSGENLVAAASLPELKRLSASLGYPIYRAGAQEGTTYELTVAPDGRVYLRYLVTGAKFGSANSDFLTIGTYPVVDPTADLRRAARSPGSVVWPASWRPSLSSLRNSSMREKSSRGSHCTPLARGHARRRGLTWREATDARHPWLLDRPLPRYDHAYR